MTNLVCFHHNDEDGRASGAIVRHALGGDARLFEMDYDDRRVPWEEVAGVARVVVVDFCFAKEDMESLGKGRELTWIDHHKSALDDMKEVSGQWDGIRDLEYAACVLTWRHFFPEQAVPRAITLIGDRDTWRWAEAETGAFSAGLHVRDTRAENDALWVPLLKDDQALMRAILEEGARLREIRIGQIEKLIARRGFEVLFEGRRTLVVNAPGNGDIGQRGRDLGYEIVYCYADQMQGDTLMTNVTLFSRQADVSLIARKYGGGGHENAAGFSFPREMTPFPPNSVVKW